VADTATISIIIPTKNAGPEFRDTLVAIRNQTRESEVIVVDSGSSDQTLELAREFGAQTLSIPPESFNHGETRNLGIRNATGTLCIMLVQDAVPIGEKWLETLIAPFSDQQVVGVTGRHVPRADSDLVGRWQVEYRSEFLGEKMRVQQMGSWDIFLTLSFEDRLRLVSFDNVCSALRRDFWERSPFQPLPFAEDLDWGVRAMAAGYRLVYDPSVRVIHSHTRPPAYHLRRSYISGRVVPKLLHLTPSDPGIRDDDELFALLGFLCGEVRTMLVERVTDWRKFSASCAAESPLWESFSLAVGVRPPPPSYKLNAVRNSFYYILECLEKMRQKYPEEPYPEEPALSSVMVYALGDAVGSFTASYYNWCEAQGNLSEGMKRLDKTLAKGV
jgi:glycosyltransferase involved in cell wall biosynthesis